MNETPKPTFEQTVWVVLWSAEIDEGEFEEIGVARVYGRRDLAEEFVRSWNETNKPEGDSRFWSEAHDVHFEHDTEGDWPM
jgi:hypothetical protein